MVEGNDESKGCVTSRGGGEEGRGVAAVPVEGLGIGITDNG